MRDWEVPGELLEETFWHLREAFALHELLCDSGGRAQDYRFLAVNPAFERMTGLKAGQVAGRTLREVFPDADPAWVEIYGRVVATGEPAHLERYSRELDRWYEITAFRVKDRLFACLFQDVTMRRLQQEQIERLSRLYLALSQVNQAVARGRDAAGMLEDACQALVQHGPFIRAWVTEADDGPPMLLLVSAQRNPGNTAGDLAHCIAVNHARQTAKPVLQWKEDEALERECRHCSCGSECAGCVALALPLADGPQLILAAQLEPGLAFDDEEMHLLQEAVGDIAFGLEKLRQERETQDARRRLKEALQRYRALFDQSPLPCLSLDDTGLVTELNAEAARLCGLNAPGRAEAFALADLLEKESFPTMQHMLEQVRAVGWSEAEVTLRCTDGSTVPVQAIARRIGDSTGEGSGVSLVMVDLRGQKQIEQERQRVAQQQAEVLRMETASRLAAGVAHDFNNLLTVIAGQAELLKLHGPGWAEWEKAVGQIRTAAFQATELTRKLMQLSKPLMPEAQPLELNQAVQREAEFLKRLLREDITLTVCTSPSPLVVRMAEDDLSRILSNLALNAQAAMPGGGQIGIVLEKKQGDVSASAAEKAENSSCARIWFSDTGCGIAPEALERIFEPFYSGRQGSGLGLGLSIVKTIVHRIGGRIGVDSRLGRGTEFCLELPLCERDESDADTAFEAAEDLKALLPARILLVDDQRDLRQTVAMMLRSAGFTVSETHSAEAALERMQCGLDPVDVLVTDVVMPGMTGIELAERARQIRPGLPILLMTGYAPEELARRTADHYAVLHKPILPQTLIPAVNALLSQSGRHA